MAQQLGTGIEHDKHLMCWPGMQEPTSATVAHLQDVKSNGDTGLTFNALMDRAKAAPQDQHVYMDSGEVRGWKQTQYIASSCPILSLANGHRGSSCRWLLQYPRDHLCCYRPVLSADCAHYHHTFQYHQAVALLRAMLCLSSSPPRQQPALLMLCGFWTAPAAAHALVCCAEPLMLSHAGSKFVKHMNIMPWGRTTICACLQVSNEQDRAKGGVRIRLKHYFARQKSGISQASSDSPI